MTIIYVSYNEMRCDHPGCKKTMRVWEGCNWRGWIGRSEGKDWDPVTKTGGWREAHYCPAHAPLHSEPVTEEDPAFPYPEAP